MVQARQFIGQVYNANNARIERLNNVRFKLSDIIKHVWRLRVDKIIDNIIEYNNTHDVKIDETYINDLKEFDNTIMHMIKILISYGIVTDEHNNGSNIDYIRDECDYLTHMVAREIFYEIVEKHQGNSELIDIVRPLVKLYDDLHYDILGYELPGIISDLSLDNDGAFNCDLLERMSFVGIKGYNITLDQ